MTIYREGAELEFHVEKELTTPDSKAHYVLSGPDNRRFLLPVTQYSHYNINTGERLICRIDRINCKGEIFLEPANPFYVEGHYYYFVIRGTDHRTDFTGNPVEVAIVTDHFGIDSIVEFRRRIPAPGSRVKLLVERITKGRLILRRESGLRRGTRMAIGEDYLFEVEKLAKGVDNCDYYVIKDPFGQRHMISRAYYESYGIKEGSTFKGKLVKYRTNGEMVIEPENPLYKPGSVLKMKITDCYKNQVTNTFTITLSDEFGHFHCIEMKTRPVKDHLLCRVKMIRKGKPLLEVL